MKPGPAPFYGVELERVMVYVVPELAQRIREEAVSRNARDNKDVRWTRSRVAHETLCAVFGIDPFKGKNGKER